ncbi:MAG: type I restriction enzyme HsdR N-terminal domain-containing protein [Chitinophagaceae bacterium]|nr:MAG: type I restriction enzyme HsdR N-terminal domain-containing protein [Chitinophagaceae bacterium]
MIDFAINITPDFSKLNIKQAEGKKYIFDIFRKKYIRLSPEEFVRQAFLQYLHYKKGYPKTLISIEKMVKNTKGRYDAMIYSNSGDPLMLIECKNAETKLNTKVLEQISRYNIQYGIPYWVITNGEESYCLSFSEKKKPEYLNDIPNYTELIKGK